MSNGAMSMSVHELFYCLGLPAWGSTLVVDVDDKRRIFSLNTSYSTV